MMAEFHGLLDEHAEGLRKPLYLQGRNGLTVVLDGPALRVEQPGQAMMFYPLVRLARVLSKGGVRWASEALLACAEVGIPVVFLKEDGAVRAYLFGASSGEDALYRCLRATLGRADGLERYRAWRRLMATHAQKALEQQLQSKDSVMVSVVAGCRLRWNGQPVMSVMPDEVLLQRLHGLLAGLSASLLLEAGIDAKRLACLESLPLVDDVAELLVWAVVAPMLMGLGGAESGSHWHSERGLTVLVEAQREEILRFGRLLLAQLRFCLEG